VTADPSGSAPKEDPMSMRFEHANLCVRNVDEMVRFLRTAFPEFEVRGEGKTVLGSRWLHVGTDETYIALQEASREPAESWVPYSQKPGTNHLGFEVGDVEALRQRMLAEGYQESTVPNKHPHRRRVYFHDREGNDWEFVEYTSHDPKLRNDYDIPDIG
jgi:catechol 2,3-dioxygenase-like lactoylglutathione lyase family enzyme